MHRLKKLCDMLFTTIVIGFLVILFNHVKKHFDLFTRNVIYLAQSAAPSCPAGNVATETVPYDVNLREG